MWKGFLLAVVIMLIAASSCVGGCIVGAAAGQEGCRTDQQWPPPAPTDNEFI